jgi:uncharacterized membrane protein YdjX (TVP38/TMEM64 family)
MSDEQVLHAVIAITVGACAAFVVHLLIGDDEGKKRK